MQDFHFHYSLKRRKIVTRMKIINMLAISKKKKLITMEINKKKEKKKAF